MARSAEVSTGLCSGNRGATQYPIAQLAPDDSGCQLTRGVVLHAGPERPDYLAAFDENLTALNDTVYV